MKKGLLVLLPALAMILAGCGGSEGGDTGTTDTPTSGTSAPTSGSTSADPWAGYNFGTEDAPLTLAEAKALIDSLNLDAPTEDAKTTKFTEKTVYIKGTVTSNKKVTDGKVQFLNLQDSDVAFTAAYSVLAEGVSGCAAENDMVGYVATVKGFAALYWKSEGQIVYEVVGSGDVSPEILKFEEPSVTHDEPAKLAKTVTELTTITGGRTQAYTSSGYIKSWATNAGAESATKTKYGNLFLWDGEHEESKLFVYGASATASMLTWNRLTGEYNKAVNPQDFLTNPLTADLEVGDQVAFWGVVYDYTSGSKTLREADAIITSKIIPDPTSVSFKQDEYNIYSAGTLDLKEEYTFLPAKAQPTVTFSIVSGESYASLENGVLTGIADGNVTVQVAVDGFPLLTDTAVVHVTTAAEGDITGITLDDDAETFYYNGTAEEKTLTVHAEVTIAGDARLENLSWTILTGSDLITVTPDGVDTLSCEINLKDVTETGTATIKVAPANHLDAGCAQTITISVSYHLNYGTLAEPLTATEAHELIDDPLFSDQETMYVGGTVVANTAYDGSHNNFDIDISDGVNTFKYLRLTTIPGWTSEQVAALAVNQVTGYRTVAHGQGTIYSGTSYQLKQGCALDVCTQQQATALAFKLNDYDVYVDGSTLNLLPEVVTTPAHACGTLKWRFEEGTIPNVSIDQDTGAITASSGAAEQALTAQVYLEEDNAVTASVAVNVIDALEPTRYNSSLTFTSTSKTGATGTADDGKEWAIASDVSESNGDATKGIHYGTNSAQVTYITLTSDDFTSGKIKKIVVNASTASGVEATVSVTVGGAAFGGAAKALTSTATEYEFNGKVDAGIIVVTIAKPEKAAKALYCKSIVVTYDA